MSSNHPPTSLHDLVHNHRQSMKSPFQWTSSHLDLIGCRFGDINTAPVNPEDTPKENDGGELSEASEYAETVALSLSSAKKIECLIEILSGAEGPFDYPQKGPPFRFQSRAAHRPDYLVFHRRENASLGPAPPVVGFVHYSKITRDRVHYRKRKKIPNTCSDDWDKDPYFVCHLVALAQLQDRMMPATSSKPPTYTSRLLITQILDFKFIFLYEAQVPRELLDGLGDLKAAIGPMAWPTIRRTKIPYEPYSTFSSRLIAELVAPVCEPSSRINDETDGSNSSKKRSREQDDQETLKRQRISSGS